MIERPLVSIVTPCLDPGSRLERCLDSVAAQTYPFVEHLVADGGSTDGTVELLEARGVKYLSEPDRGQTDAINKGFALAAGDWLGWLNADDVLTPRAVESTIDALRAADGAGWAYGDCTMRLEDDVHHWAPPRELTARMFERGNPIPQPGALVARWALDRVGPLDDELHLVMDYDLWLRLFDAGVPYVYVPETLSVFELHDASKSIGIPGSEFLVEEAVALLERGWLRPAAVMLGNAAGSAARNASGAVDRGRLDAEVAAMLRRVVGRSAELDADLVRASAYAQAAEGGLFGRPRRFGYLARPEAWARPETRRRLVSVILQSLLRRLRTLRD